METIEPANADTGRHVPERFPFTKFLPPVLDDRVVTEHLVARLDATMDTRPLTLLTAPAGSGKTTVLAAWAASATTDVVWIRLGPDDNEPAVFAAAILEGGRRQLGDGFGSRLARLLAYAGTAPTSQQLVTSLVNDLGDHGRVTVIFDDVHHVTDPTASAFLEELLDHLPPEVKVVLSSRVEPAVGISRRRVRGEVAELGLDGLRLDRETIRRVLAHDAPVSDDQVDTVLAASSGWAAAVRMATAHKESERASSVAVPDILSDLRPFLAEEVLDPLPEGLRSFLLETSILDELWPPHCDAVSGRSDSYQVLLELDRRNLFLTRHHDDAGDTWRVHDLFSTFLREQLAARYPAEQIRELHRRASRALAPFQALPHLLAADEHTAATDLIVHLAMSDLDSSTVLRLAPAIRDLPLAVRETNHFLKVLQIWPRHLAGKAHDVILELEPLRERLISAGDGPAAAEVDVMLAEAYLQLGDLARAGAAIDHALSQPGEPWHRSSVLSVATWWNYYRNDWTEASRCLEEALDLVLQSGEPRLFKLVGPSLSPLLLFVDRGPGWVIDAVDQLVAGLSQDDHATLTGMRPVRAGAALLRLDVARATTELRQCLAESTGYGGMAWKHQEAEVLLMAVSLGTGDLTTVQRILDDALPRLDEPVYRQYRQPYVYAALRLHWLVGEHRQLVSTSERLLAAEPSDGQAADAVLRSVAEGMLARIEGRTDDALEALLAGEQAQRDGRCWLWTGLPGLDRASILLENGRVAAAMEAALPTLEVAARFGAGILLPEARANRAVLERCIRAGVHADLLRAVLSASQSDGPPREPVSIPGTNEVLSQRELEVLAHVASGASNQEVAGALFISQPTVKSHLTRILRKLNATSRTHAVARARELRLL